MYDKQLKEEILKEIEEGGNIPQISKRTGIHTTTIRKWKRYQRKLQRMDRQHLKNWDPQFPKVDKHVWEGTLEEQLVHVADEVHEAEKALEKLRMDGKDVEPAVVNAFLIEIMDIIHAAETAVDMAQDELALVQARLDGCKKKVIDKNFEREYYDEV